MSATHPASEHPTDRLPVAIIGGGPIGLVASAHLVKAGLRPMLFEAGEGVGSNVRDWGHVRLFSPWKYLIDPVAAGFLDQGRWARPNDEDLPTGHEFVDGFLEPLVLHPDIRPHVHFSREVLGVTRKGMDKVKSSSREHSPFELTVRGPDGMERHLARAVIDASGTWGTPNPMGAGGVPAEGEVEHASQIRYGIPDVLGMDRRRYAGRTTLVVGSGHSAFNVVLDLVRLAESAAGTEIIWAIRRDQPGQMFGGGERDGLPARGSLGVTLKTLVDDGRVTFATGFRTTAIKSDERRRLSVWSGDGRVLAPVDRIVATTGFRPDLQILRELRLELDPWLEAPIRLAPLIDPNLHSCGTVYPHGFEELRHPEQDAFVVGMKSYGRAPTFLMLTGYEQVRSVTAALTGDMEAARDVQLVLPETGVCVTDLADDDCCGTIGVSDAVSAASCSVSGDCGSQTVTPVTATESQQCCA